MPQAPQPDPSASPAETSPEEQERRFRRFTRRLLEAQRYDFLDEELFTLENLSKTFTEFCDIIAEELEAESCTIHLQLYDPESLDAESLERDIEQKLERLAARHGFTGEEERGLFWSARGPLLRETTTFPYWLYPKGASLLTASNRGGPWAKLLSHRSQRIAPLRIGISKQIYQDSSARIRDHLSIQRSRGFQRLGGVDAYVWTNTEWQSIFRNFYGVPLQIHSLGESIGILKVENKKPGPEASLSTLLVQSEDLENQFSRHITERNSGKPLREISTSLLALAYLLRDIRTDEFTRSLDGDSPDSQILLPFPHVDYESFRKDLEGSEDKEAFSEIIRKQGEAKYTSLRPVDRDHRPPIQIFASSLEEEQRLWELLLSRKEELEREVQEESLEELITKVYALYEKIRVSSEQISYSKLLNEGLVTSSLGTLSLERSADLPDFCFKLVFTTQGGAAPDLYIRIAPKPNELGKAAKLFGKSAKHYEKINLFWSLKSEARRRHSPGFCLGEFVFVEDAEGKHKITDLLADRLAARTQSLIQALPQAEFSAPDTRKLSWAALEIGKLIEREIAYRANHSRNPMPLTAMEFYRIPISHLCFVDDLRKRRQRGIPVQADLDRRIRSILEDSQLAPSTRYLSRVKEYRSLLGRLGERYEGLIRGNLALGFLLLYFRRGELASATGAEESCPELEDFRARLESFGQIVEPIFEKILRRETGLAEMQAESSEDAGSSDIRTLEEVRRFIEWGRFLDDFRFSTPPWSCIKDKEEPLDRVLETLFREDLLVFEGTKVVKESVEALKSALEGFLRKPSAELDEEWHQTLEDLLFRTYDSFAQAEYSLFCQLANSRFLKREAGLFRRFYSTCFQLRALLCKSRRDLESERDLADVRGVFEHLDTNSRGEGTEKGPRTLWMKLLEFLDQYSTTDLRRCLRPDASQETLLFNFIGTYKRTRMMHHFLRRQVAASCLEWELGRFDLVGSRAVCLFGHQVFSLYEYLWNRGDPFFSFRLEERNLDRFVADQSLEPGADPPFEKASEDRWRQPPPWLGIRTKVSGSGYGASYRAVHLAVLMDPESVREVSSKHPIYTPETVRRALGILLRQFDPEFYERYPRLAYHRNLIRRKYSRWSREVESRTRRGRTAEAKADSRIHSAAFLFEGVIDVLILLLERQAAQDPGREPDTKVIGAFRPGGAIEQLLETVPDILAYGKEYSKRLTRGLLEEENLGSHPFRCRTWNGPASDTCKKCRENGGPPDGGNGAWDRPGPCRIYGKIRSLLEDLKGTWILPEAEGLALTRLLEREQKYFEDLETTDPHSLGVVFFIREEKARDLEAELKAVKAITDLHSLGPGGGLVPWARFLKRFHVEHASFLLERGRRSDRGGLWLREGREVLERLQNYLLLFSADREGKGRQEFAGWTAYDLFYYVRSLIPVEIQIRTELADTVAEQYHDPLYKGRPSTATILARKRIEALGEELEDWDLDMDRVYQDYVRQAQQRDG